ncbi:stage II sporulation protein E [Alkalicella caledoniensis]|uniref:Stage II sporulation protein E n=1 Tax=Alkalicella caledoniensis TaxID=2731377 RepID=A0A7G9W848_ALKCA|nr:stage II sporulation protein E [Alkalicella caledoniensis]QNO14860.1 stage II sporulation protein E [Alkalicella caledoniensis]
MINKETYRWATPKTNKGILSSIKDFIKSFVSPNYILFNIFVLLFANVSILEGISPFLLPFLAVIPVANMPGAVLLTTVYGVAVQNPNTLLILFSASVIWWIKVKSQDKTNYVMLVLPLLIGFSYLPNLVMSEFLSFDLLLLTLQIIIGVTAGYIFKQGVELLELSKGVNKNLEIKICAVIMTGIALSGISTLTILGVSVIGTLSKLSLLLVALIGGMKYAAAFGLIVGLLTNFSHPHITYFISYYGFVSLTAGVMNQWRKLGVLLGFIAGSIVMYMYSIEFFEVSSLLMESAVAIILFTSIPKSLQVKITQILTGELEEKHFQKQVKDAAIKKIYQFSGIFRELSQGFSEVAVSKLNVEQQSVNEIIDTVQKRGCKDCKKYSLCWHNEFYGTYKDVFSLVSLAEEGKLNKSNVPDQLFRKCINITNIIDITESSYELHKVNYKWQQRLIESKSLVANQLEGMASVMEQLAMDINLDIGPRKNVEEELWDLLYNAGIECDDIKVKGLERENPEVQIIKTACNGCHECEQTITSVLEKRFKTQMCVLKGNCGLHSKGACEFLLMPKEKYKMSIAIAQKAQGEVSGDTFNQFAINNGKHVVVLSDGMGKGEKAKEESERIVGLIKKLLQIGFDTEKAIKSVNSILSLRNKEESFATLDIAVIDLYKGKTDFYKNGAVSSFIKSGNEVLSVDNSNLPVGMVDDVESSISSHTLQKGDFLVMVSDGILDSNPTATDKEGWLKMLLENITPNISPNRLSELILHKSRQRGIETNLDDLSVIVIKMESNNQPAVLGRWLMQKGV